MSTDISTDISTEATHSKHDPTFFLGFITIPSYNYVISYHLITSVTISLEKIICWPHNEGLDGVN